MNKNFTLSEVVISALAVPVATPALAAKNLPDIKSTLPVLCGTLTIQ